MGHHQKQKREKEKADFVKPKRRLMPFHSYAEEDKKFSEGQLPMVTMRAGRWVHVENYGVITAYGAEALKLSGKTWKICVEGKNLSLVYFTEDDLLVSGRIAQIHFL